MSNADKQTKKQQWQQVMDEQAATMQRVAEDNCRRHEAWLRERRAATKARPDTDN